RRDWRRCRSRSTPVTSGPPRTDAAPSRPPNDDLAQVEGSPGPTTSGVEHGGRVDTARSQASGAVNTGRSLPLSPSGEGGLSGSVVVIVRVARVVVAARAGQADLGVAGASVGADHGRSEETRLNSSHVKISYAVFCLKKKK